MSATNRGGERRKNDAYETPAWAIELLLENVPKPHRVFDPCAGNGALLRAALRFGVPGTGIDIEPILEDEWAIRRIQRGNFLETPADQCGNASCIIMNPPYSKALEFVQHALRVAPVVHVLLRLGFLEGQARGEWLSHNMPSHIRVLSKRPSFTGKGTDAAAYAWFTWEGYGRTESKTSILMP